MRRDLVASRVMPLLRAQDGTGSPVAGPGRDEPTAAVRRSRAAASVRSPPNTPPQCRPRIPRSRPGSETQRAPPSRTRRLPAPLRQPRTATLPRLEPRSQRSGEAARPARGCLVKRPRGQQQIGRHRVADQRDKPPGTDRHPSRAPTQRNRRFVRADTQVASRRELSSCDSRPPSRQSGFGESERCPLSSEDHIPPGASALESKGGVRRSLSVPLDIRLHGRCCGDRLVGTRESDLADLDREAFGRELVAQTTHALRQRDRDPRVESVDSRAQLLRVSDPGRSLQPDERSPGSALGPGQAGDGALRTRWHPGTRTAGLPAAAGKACEREAEANSKHSEPTAPQLVCS